MKAVVLPAFGGPEVLEMRELERPEPGPGELLVRVVASATNPVEAKIRAAGSWAGIPLPATIGYDAAGIVEACGPGVAEFTPGDRVYYTPHVFGNAVGTHAEYNVVRAEIVAPKPPSLSFAEAAAMPLAAGTAYEAIVRRLSIRVGETVLVHGGAGGVGSFAVQIARAAGARVLATAGRTNQELLRELGADVAIDYADRNTTERVLAATDGRGVDAVFDTVGGNLIAESVAFTRAFGRLATILTPSGELSAFSVKNLTLHGIFLTRERARLEALTSLVQQGRLRSVIDRVAPLGLDAVRDAHRRLDSGHGRGKFVFQVCDDPAA